MSKLLRMYIIMNNLQNITYLLGWLSILDFCCVEVLTVSILK